MIGHIHFREIFSGDWIYPLEIALEKWYLGGNSENDSPDTSELLIIPSREIRYSFLSARHQNTKTLRTALSERKFADHLQ